MHYVRLIATGDEYDTDLGLALKKADHNYEGFMADRTGGLLAHDIIEHQNGAQNIGSVDDELEACGGVWHTRGRWGDFESRYHTPHYHVASDIGRMFMDAEDWRMPATGIRLHEEIEEDLEEIIEESKKYIKSEVCGYESDIEIAHLEAYLEAARRRFRIGYRKATRRFGSDFLSNQMYRNIRRAVEKTAKHIDIEGQEFILGYDRHDATIRELEYDYG